MRAGPLAAGCLLLASAAHAQGAGSPRDPAEVRRLVDADRYGEARAALRGWWAASGDTVTGDRRAAALYLRAVLSDSLDAAERDLLRVAVEHPLAPEADDALHRLAHSRLARGDSAGAALHLQRLGSDFPGSPHREPGLALLSRLRRAGIAVASSAPAPSRPAQPTAPAPASAGRSAAAEPGSGAIGPAAQAERYTVQVATERVIANAARLRDALRAKGFDAFLVVIGDDGTVRVRVGDFSSREAADRETGRLRRAGYRGTVVEAGG